MKPTDHSRPPVSVLVAHPGADLYGSDRVLLESVEGFIGRDMRVVVTVPEPGPLVTELQRRGAAVVLCPTPVLRKSLLSPAGVVRLAAESARGLLRGAALLRRYRPDVLYVSTVTIPLWPLLGRLTRRPVTTHVHEAEQHASRLLRVALALPLTLATSIVANSRFSVDNLESSLPLLRGRAAVLYNGVPGPGELVPPRDALTGGIRLVYVGRLSHRKGADVAVSALAELRRRGIEASLDVVGAVYPGYEAFEADLHALVRDAGLDGRVRFHGFQPSMWRFLAAADVAVVPSRLDEPFGNTAVEAVLAGRPVVVSDTSGLREAAGGYACAQSVEPGSAAALADAVARIAADWEGFRTRAVADAAVAAAKHSPVLYRERIADVVGARLGNPAWVRDAAGALAVAGGESTGSGSTGTGSIKSINTAENTSR